MKALSIRQPWLWAIIYCGKDIENRSWSTKYRGPVLLHAAKGMSDDEFDEGMDFVDRVVPLDKAGEMRRRARFVNGEDRRGGIVGAAEIVDCVTQSDSPWFFGPYGFVLRNARPLPFRPCRGQLGFFTPYFSELNSKDKPARAQGTLP
jgi:hypothetical protein